MATTLSVPRFVQGIRVLCAILSAAVLLSRGCPQWPFLQARLRLPRPSPAWLALAGRGRGLARAPFTRYAHALATARAHRCCTLSRSSSSRHSGRLVEAARQLAFSHNRLMSGSVNCLHCERCEIHWSTSSMAAVELVEAVCVCGGAAGTALWLARRQCCCLGV